jgi:hypothetical protein
MKLIMFTQEPGKVLSSMIQSLKWCLVLWLDACTKISGVSMILFQTGMCTIPVARTRLEMLLAAKEHKISVRCSLPCTSLILCRMLEVRTSSCLLVGSKDHL